jgi:hypothetical protein
VYRKIFYGVVLLLLILFAIYETNRKNRINENKINSSVVATPDIRTIIVKNDTTKDAAFGGFGYRIYVLSGTDTAFRLFQPAIPAIQGQKGFTTFSDAEKVAALAAGKIKEGNSFPTISIAELDSLGIDVK